MTDLKTKSVLVTGGSRGIGGAIARAVGAAGGEVVVHCARHRDAAEAVRHEIGRERCHIVQADLAIPDEVDRLWSETLANSSRTERVDQQRGNLRGRARRGVDRGLAGHLVTGAAG